MAEACASEIFLFDFDMGYDKTMKKITKENDMGLDQYAHLRNRKIDWKKYYSDDETKVRQNKKMFSFGENTQDFKHL